jgi:putative NIF3 family GTP cyclohydrolase 1 type 2
MSHHEVLDANHHGVTVILCDHSNTERGYLTVAKDKLTALLENQVEIILSEKDKDPLEIV